jgi:hypothetical protein
VGLGFLVSRCLLEGLEVLVVLGLLAGLEDLLDRVDLGFLGFLVLPHFLALLVVLEFQLDLEFLEDLVVQVVLRLMGMCRCND